MSGLSAKGWKRPSVKHARSTTAPPATSLASSTAGRRPRCTPWRPAAPSSKRRSTPSWRPRASNCPQCSTGLKRWRRTAAQDRAQLEAEYREALFAEPPEEELGSVQELGWYGLRHHEGRPGGVVLSQDEQGFRQVWKTDSDEALSERWQALQTMYAQFLGSADDEAPADDTALPNELDADRDEDAGVTATLTPGETEPPDDDLSEPLAWTANGYDWIDHLPEGWWTAPVWGREGWALGRWPIEVVAMSESAASGRYAVAVFIEGEVTVRRYDSRKELYRAIDEIAESFWRSSWEYGPADLPPVTGLLPHHRGPYDQRRPDMPAEDDRQERE